MAAFIATLAAGLAIVRYVKNGSWWVDISSTLIAAFSIVVFLNAAEERQTAAIHTKDMEALKTKSDIVILTTELHKTQRCKHHENKPNDLCAWLGDVSKNMALFIATNDPYYVSISRFAPSSLDRDDQYIVDEVVGHLRSPIFPYLERTEFIDIDAESALSATLPKIFRDWLSRAMTSFLRMADRLWPFLFSAAFALKISKHAHDNVRIRERLFCASLDAPPVKGDSHGKGAHNPNRKQADDDQAQGSEGGNMTATE
ncbi:MAG: hypothetical protein Q7R40_03010 [Phaeospirillum sp.]|nr:hypothetical protein [Phaeospirillum sp.]